MPHFLFYIRIPKKTHLQIGYLFFCLFFSALLHSQSERPSYTYADYAAYEKEAFVKSASGKATASSIDFDLLYHRCYWEIDPAQRYIQGYVMSYFKPLVSGFDHLYFDMSADLSVDSITYHGSHLTYTLATNDVLSIQLPMVLTKNSRDSLCIFYKGIPSTKNGAGAFVQSEHSGSPIVWTLSEPFGAKAWWPCKQDLNDKIDSIDIYVNTPKAYRAASNGLLMNETSVQENKLYHWKSRYPTAAYLVAIGVSNYTVYSDYLPLKTSTLEILNYVYPESVNETKQATKEIVKIIQFYDSLLIEYPFSKEKYGHAQFGAGGGMEHQTMSFMGAFYLSLMAHECAHQWFGDHITCGSWEDIWLNEGFATYFEWLVTERYDLSGWTKGLPNVINNITALPDGSVLCDDTLKASRIFDARLSYAKGAFVLRMLRFKLGDKNFFEGLKNYLNDPALASKYAKTPQLIKHLELSSGQNLSTYFDQWYYKQGFPSYTVAWDQVGTVLSVTISQTQSHSSVTYFEMPVPIKFEARDRDTLFVFDNTFSGQTFTVDAEFVVSKAHFDPNLILLSANNKVIDVKNLKLNTSPLSLYPNPSNKSITVSGISAGARMIKLEISDQMGKVLFSDKNQKIISDSIVLDIQSLSSGAYTLRIETDKGMSSLKFVKH